MWDGLYKDMVLKCEVNCLPGNDSRKVSLLRLQGAKVGEKNESEGEGKLHLFTHRMTGFKPTRISRDNLIKG